MAINYEMLGDRIRLIRTSRNYSQERLAEEASLTRETISRIEKGSLKPKLETLVDIALILNVPIDYLVSSKEEDEIDTGSDLIRLLLDCNYTEKQILIDSIRSLKKILFNAGV